MLIKAAKVSAMKTNPATEKLLSALHDLASAYYNLAHELCQKGDIHGTHDAVKRHRETLSRIYRLGQFDRI
jgi:nitrate reductase assembly molybdenum cofactor insertion protein NarJ